MHAPHAYETKIPEEVAEDLVLLESRGYKFGDDELSWLAAGRAPSVGRLAEFENPVANRTALS